MATDVHPVPTIQTSSYSNPKLVFDGLLDTGASRSLISSKLARKLDGVIEYGDGIHLTCANDTKVSTLGKVIMSIVLGNREIHHEFLVCDKLVFPLIIGNDIILREGIVPNPIRASFHFDSEPNVEYPMGSSLGKIAFTVRKRSENEMSEINNRTAELLAQYPMVCRKDNMIGQTDYITHKIETTGEIVADHPYYQSPSQAAEIDRQTKGLLQNGLIRSSRSPYGFNVVLAKKATGSWRMAINYKKLNAITKRNAAPMHNSNVILRLLPTGGYYSTIGMKSGFWQIKLDEESIEKTAFYANGSLYEWLVMPFGLKNATATFVTLMNKVLDGYVGKFVLVFVDDIIIFSKTLEEHLHHLRLVLERLKEFNLTVNMEKSHFAKRRRIFRSRGYSRRT
jgi:hypothetical protein